MHPYHTSSLSKKGKLQRKKFGLSRMSQGLMGEIRNVKLYLM